ncbi:MAG: hypothetical protein EBU90_31220, partial [Proteobacteria bacterium]|nr:hypothetical protein [Pseudomonadota bacterium]
ANYSKYYENIQPPKILAEESAAEMRARQSGVYKEQRDRDITNAAYIYAKRTGLSVDESLNLIKAKDENMRLKASFDVQQETRNLKANNDYIKAQSEIANIAYTDKNALNKLSEIRAKWSPSLAGTEYETNWAKSIASLESGVSNYQTSQHYQNLDDPDKQAFLTKTKAIAESEAKAPFASAEEEAKKQTAIQRAILQYAVKNDMSVSEATEALYPTMPKPAVPTGKPQATATPSMPSDVVTKIPQGSGLQITGGLGTPIMGVEQPKPVAEKAPQIMSPIDESDETTEAPGKKPLTKDVLHSLADELGPNATKESLMDLAKKRGYTF